MIYEKKIRDRMLGVVVLALVLANTIATAQAAPADMAMAVGNGFDSVVVILPPTDAGAPDINVPGITILMPTPMGSLMVPPLGLPDPNPPQDSAVSLGRQLSTES